MKLEVEIPFELTIEQLTTYQEDDSKMDANIERSLSWLRDEWLAGRADRAEIQRIMTAAVCAMERGVDLRKALNTAIIWERG